MPGKWLSYDQREKITGRRADAERGSEGGDLDDEEFGRRERIFGKGKWSGWCLQYSSRSLPHVLASGGRVDFTFPFRCFDWDVAIPSLPHHEGNIVNNPQPISIVIRDAITDPCLLLALQVPFVGSVPPGQTQD